MSTNHELDDIEFRVQNIELSLANMEKDSASILSLLERLVDLAEKRNDILDEVQTEATIIELNTRK